MNKINKNGFTIVELLVAMAVFQVILVLTLVAYMQISKYYQKSINATRMHQIAGNIVDDISRTIQNTGGLVTSNDLLGGNNIDGGNQDTTNTQLVTVTVPPIIVNGNTFNVICVDSTRYLYRVNVMEPGNTVANNGQHVFMSDVIPTPSACASASFPYSNLRVILGQNMTLVSFGVKRSANNAVSNSYIVWINAAFTSDITDVDSSTLTIDAVTGAPTPNSYISCLGGAGRQFCATANVNTTVVRRIGL